MRLAHKYIKVVSVFLLLNMVNYIFFPMVSMALTSGPIAPDYASFEPFDTNEMVNLSTGDFNYNMPVLNVPGPAGGYPMSLAYHAGITPNEDASWVGLGWALNPGAINRTVNGFADDFLNVTDVSRYYWEGGESKSYYAGYSGSVLGVANVSADVGVTSDTYDGVKWYGQASGTVSYSLQPGISFNYSLSVDHTGKLANNQSASFNLGGVGLMTIDRDQNWSAVFGLGPVAASISSKSKGVSVSVAGFSPNRSSNKSGNISTKSKGFNWDIPLKKGTLSLGYNKTRYWQDELEDVSVNGSLYFPDEQLESADLEEMAFDSYHLVDQMQLMDQYGSMGTFRETDFFELNGRLQSGGSLPDYDNYIVTGQGVGGAMRPYLFKKHLLTQNKTSGNDEIYSYVTGYDQNPVGFRFVGDLSNSLKYDSNSGGIPSIGDDTNFTVDLVAGEDKDDIPGFVNNQLAGSRNIKYFTNSQIDANDEIVNSDALGFARRTDLSEQIGGYVITNESGVKYHYSLPAYSYDEYQYTENTNKNQEGDKFNELIKSEPYAYVWHLEGITGPDYVDRGPDGNADGILNEFDWGYWVDFDYGKWTDQYFWRTPGEGMHLDLDNKFRTFSEGTKEIYYLNSINTATHTALFVKKVREDAKSSLKYFRNLKAYENPVIWKTRPDGGVTQKNKKGSFTSKSLSNLAKYGGSTNYFNYNVAPTLSLGLERIVLYENETYSNKGIDVGSYEGDPPTPYYWDKGTSGGWSGLENYTFDQHKYENVLDVGDIDESSFSIGSLKSIEFNSDYSLVPSTPNSTSGKLTLNSIRTYGRDGVSTLPSLKFGYDLETEFNSGYIMADSNDDVIYLNSENLGIMEPGDLMNVIYDNHRLCLDYPGVPLNCEANYVEFSGSQYYTVEEQFGSQVSLRPIPGNIAPTSAAPIENVQFRITKNPAYSKEAYDNWRMFKSDFDASQVGISDPAARAVTEISAKSTDVWSLRKITTQLGSTIEIEYEPDVYDEVATVGSQFFTIYEIETLGNETFRIHLNEDIDDLGSYYRIGDKIEVSAVYAFKADQYYAVSIDGLGESYGDSVRPKRLGGSSKPMPYPVNAADVYVSAVGTNYIEISSQRLESLIVDVENSTGEQIMITGYSKYQEKVNGTWYDREKKNFNAYYNTAPDYFYGGYVSSGQRNASYGGDIRVKSITQRIDEYNSSSVNYEYFDGVTSYLPFSILPAKKGKDALTGNLPSNRQSDLEIENLVQMNSYNLYEPIMANSRVLPSPGVNYRKTLVWNEVQSSGVNHGPESKTEYIFRQFEEGDVSIQPLFGGYSSLSYYKGFESFDSNFEGKTIKGSDNRKILKQNRTSLLGQVTEINELDLEGNVLTRIENQYKESNEIGIVSEVFLEARITEEEGNEFIYRRTETVDSYIPHYLYSSTSTNYKTGNSVTTKNLNFDFYSGEVTETLTSDGYGNQFVTKSVPAYRLESSTAENTTELAYPDMGLALNGGKNMLSQSGASYTYLVDNDYNPDEDLDYSDHKIGLMGASLQTWSDNNQVMDGWDDVTSSYPADIYRKQATYSFIGDDQYVQDGMYSVDPLIFSEAILDVDNTIDSDSRWQKSAEITLFDVNSHVLEVSDVNGNFAATRMDQNNERVIATVANGSYDEFVYSGFEEGVSGGVIVIGDVITDQEMAHSGSNYVQSKRVYDGWTLSDDYYSMGRVLKEGTYRVSYWTTDQTSVVETKKVIQGGSSYTALPTQHLGTSNGWHLMEAIVSFDESSKVHVANSYTAKFDDFRICPLDAAMTSYVYNEWGELSYILDANNLYTHYAYDSMGKLKSVTRENLTHGPVKTSEVNVIYKRGID